MLTTYPAEVRKGRINIFEKAKIPDGSRVFVTVIDQDDSQFWLKASSSALDRIWNTSADDVYADLLKK